ncbi:MAG: NAD(P)-dependent oxidoreductase [Candidatus Puniceispirillum sp.]|nr:NAD(P)-dependent oxidoreductase [Candidatus Puniceispirillum sp.]MBL6774567.1 NAD(P)-dependent oxidoreductase [Candidatus Puniceispirillum sp.]
MKLNAAKTPLNENSKLGFIGLGNMGAALAMRLLAPNLMVFDPNPVHIAPFIDGGAMVGADATMIAEECDVIFACLPTSAVTESVLYGDGGIASRMKPGQVFVDMTSGDPAISRDQAARLAAAGIDFVDAPVSGGPRGAREGVIAIIVGGDRALYDNLLPLLQRISCNIFHAGPVGAGHALKAGNNLLNLICRMASFEVVSLLVNAGVDPDRAVDILQKSSGRNYATEITLPDNILSGKMHQGFSMELMRKDAGLALGMAAAMAQDMPLGVSAFRALQEAIDSHGADADMSFVALSFEAKTGARIRPK